MTTPGSMYVPCSYCYGFYSVHTAQKHMSKCGKTDMDAPIKKNTLAQCRTLISKHIHPQQEEFEKDMTTLFSGLSETKKYPGL